MVTMRLALEDTYHIKLTPSHTVWGWLARHAAWLVARYLVKINNKTAYLEAFDTEYRGEIVPWGETILFRRPRPEHRGLGRDGRQRRGDPAWERGIWLGRVEDSEEHLVATEAGVWKARSLRRLEPERAHDARLLLAVRGLPWNMERGTVGRPRLQKFVALPVAVGGEPSRGADFGRARGASRTSDPRGASSLRNSSFPVSVTGWPFGSGSRRGLANGGGQAPGPEGGGARAAISQEATPGRATSTDHTRPTDAGRKRKDAEPRRKRGQDAKSNKGDPGQ